MSRTANPTTKKSGTIKLSLTEANKKKLFALSKLDGKPAAVIVREVVEEYLARRAGEIVDSAVECESGGDENGGSRERV